MSANIAMESSNLEIFLRCHCHRRSYGMRSAVLLQFLT